MAVKRSRSATRMLQVFEGVARQQPVGVSALARALAADKSAVQRDLMTLADAGWIRAAPGGAGQWELTAHILTLARAPSSADSLRLRARPLLEHLRTETGETAYLAVPEGQTFVVVDAAESNHMLRMVPPVGIVIDSPGSATFRAVLPQLDETEQTALLGAAPSAALRAGFNETLARGFTVSDGDIQAGAVAIAAAIPGTLGGGRPAGVLVLTGPRERLPPERWAECGALLGAAARQLSAG